MKKLSAVFVLLVLAVTMIACTKKTYKLELPNEVTANVDDLNKVTINTLVTLTINKPSNGELEWLKVNDEEVEVVDFKYEFKITKDTKLLSKLQLIVI